MKTHITSVVLLVDPRFSGGTSAAVAREIYALSAFCRLKVAAVSSSMFKGRDVHPLIEAACVETATPLTWDPPVVSADVVVVHNPSFLKFDQTLSTRIFTTLLAVVCHENFLRPTGAEAFDVSRCLGLIERVASARHRILAPVSGWNRDCVARWLEKRPSNWKLAEENWTNICDFVRLPPPHVPRDRRGRHSRPGMEKFPTMEDLRAMFPPEAERVRILGADHMLGEPCQTEWELIPFGAEPVDDFLRSIDFMVYFTNPTWRESFGRVIAEALAAGKVVITDADTARTFGDGVISALPHEVNNVVACLIDDPQAYHAQAAKGHTALEGFSTDAFTARVRRIFRILDAVTPKTETLHALL